MTAESPAPAARPGCAKSRLARRIRKGLLCGIALLYAASIPWYRGDAPVGRLFGLPDWVAVALLCYALAALFNSAAWLLTEVPDSTHERER
jgi:hypothetical protein